MRVAYLLWGDRGVTSLIRVTQSICPWRIFLGWGDISPCAGLYTTPPVRSTVCCVTHRTRLRPAVSLPASYTVSSYGCPVFQGGSASLTYPAPAHRAPRKLAEGVDGCTSQAEGLKLTFLSYKLTFLSSHRRQLYLSVLRAPRQYSSVCSVWATRPVWSDFRFSLAYIDRAH